MKKSNLVLALLLSASMVVPTLVGAQAPDTLPGAGWWTGQQIQNVGTGNATVVSTAYDATNPANVYTAQYGPLAPDGSITFLPSDFVGMPSGFQGSAVVSADQPIKAIVSLTNRQVGSFGTPGGLAGGQYQGVDGAAASTSVNFPIVKNAFGSAANNKTTTLFIQNAGSNSATVTVNFACGAGGNHSYTTPSIAPGQMAVVNAGSGPDPVPAASLCSGTATSTQPIAGVAAEHYTTETTATLVQATRGFTSADYGATIYAPIFKKRFPTHATRSRTGGAQVQNVGAGTIDITANYVAAAGTCTPGSTYTQTVTGVLPGAAANFLYPPTMPDGCLASANFVASAGQIVGIVNESYLDPAPAAGTQSATAYNMSPSSAATTEVVAPLYKEKFGNKTSGLQIQNTNASTAANIVAVFRSGANTYTTNSISVPAGGSYTFYLVSAAAIWSGTPMPAGTNASVSITSDQPILGGVAEQPWYSTDGNCYGQATVVCFDRQNYEAFNVAP